MNPEDVYAEIEALGSTADEIAEGLRVKGVRGFRAARCGCPMAVFINRLLGANSCEVTPNYFRLWCDPERLHKLPEPAREFVLFFDAGRFPFLLPGKAG